MKKYNAIFRDRTSRLLTRARQHNREHRLVKNSEGYMLLRQMQMNDIDTLVVIAKTSMINSWNRAVFLDCFKPDYFGWVIVDSNSNCCVGFVVVLHQLHRCELLAVAVAKDYQCQGLATRLLQHTIEHAKRHQMTHIDLEVRASNTAAQALYRSLGFRQHGKRRNYYATQSHVREDALLFNKLL